jgi:mannose-1-phosphate guanylyltransferase/mannose-6-phosphate isomerase
MGDFQVCGGAEAGMNEPIVSFVMSGGVGSRLWPLSREDNPKQFHSLAGDRSMLAQTLRRMKACPGPASPVFVIASERHAERVLENLAPIDGGGAIFEPVGRNTAAAVAIATLHTLAVAGDALALVAPSDHDISTDAQFWDTVAQGARAARAGRLVVFGVRPTAPETGYGYIEAGPAADGVADVTRFVEKPDLETAERYLAAGNFYWNAGIFLFRAGAMRDAFLKHAPDIWAAAGAAYAKGVPGATGLFLPMDDYLDIPSTSIDYAIMERAGNIGMAPATFRWNDLGSWRSLLDIGPTDAEGNVVVGDVVAIDCRNSYLRSEGRLVSAVGLRDTALVVTADATFVAPVSHSQHVKKVVERLERSGRLETKYTPASDRILASGAWRRRVRSWLFDEALPLWSTTGVDARYGGFHEALTMAGEPLAKPKRIRTQARQIYAFCVAKDHGWTGPADAIIAQGLDFLARHARTQRGAWVRAVSPDGATVDPAEDAYDHACMLLALAHAHKAGNPDAMRLGQETMAFMDKHLEDKRMTGFLETSDGAGMRRSNPHMHLLEAFLAWHEVTGERRHLRRAARIVDLFQTYFFDRDSWTLGEYFDDRWQPAAGTQGQWTEPGHHFEWAALLVQFSVATDRPDLVRFARKLYASAVANGLNRATGLAYAAVSREGVPLDGVSRSWPQTEAIKAAIALDSRGGPDLKPEIEARVGRLFRWHIDPAISGLWIDRIDERGRAVAVEVPASILYHITSALSAYLDATGNDG